MNRREYLLNKLIQECAEVIQAATKCKEFGMGDIWPEGSVTNEDKLQTEYAELAAVMSMITLECLVKSEFSVEKNAEIIRKKVKKVNHWSEYSRERGCLTEESKWEGRTVKFKTTVWIDDTKAKGFNYSFHKGDEAKCLNDFGDMIEFNFMGKTHKTFKKYFHLTEEEKCEN